jgi:hypothetical protein
MAVWSMELRFTIWPLISLDKIQTKSSLLDRFDDVKADWRIKAGLAGFCGQDMTNVTPVA